jgi:hypothetical protein
MSSAIVNPKKSILVDMSIEEMSLHSNQFKSAMLMVNDKNVASVMREKIMDEVFLTANTRLRVGRPAPLDDKSQISLLNDAVKSAIDLRNGASGFIAESVKEYSDKSNFRIGYGVSARRDIKNSAAIEWVSGLIDKQEVAVKLSKPSKLKL